VTTYLRVSDYASFNAAAAIDAAAGKFMKMHLASELVGER
jgi:hypothetical protein